MADVRCEGSVQGLGGQTVCFTGRVLVDGEWTVRTRCAERAERLGATVKTDFSRKVTLVVSGDLASKVVTDTHRGYSGTLVDAADQRGQGWHVCVVDGDGFSNLLHRRPAPCLKLRRTAHGRVRPMAPPETGGGILGVPLQMRQVGRHTPEALTADLSSLERATAAHESTVGALIAYLNGQGVEVRTHARNTPKFDAGWTRGTETFIAEIKSLTGTNEDQQIRLGIGQVLDYTHRLRTAHPNRPVRPVLILEKRPADARWASLTQSIGIRLSWAPEFAGL